MLLSFVGFRLCYTREPHAPAAINDTSCAPLVNRAAVLVVRYGELERISTFLICCSIVITYKRAYPAIGCNRSSQRGLFTAWSLHSVVTASSTTTLRQLLGQHEWRPSCSRIAL